MNQKGFIQIPLLIAIIVATVSVASVGAGVVLYKQQKTPFFTANVSEIIYQTVYERKFEVEELKQEAELSKTREERAQKYAQEEIAKRTEAETAKEEAEQKAKEETIKRSQAESKAKQEEFEKKLKEQQLSEKEAEEKRMNADNDGDGLTYREEEKMGTSDWNTDSDGDGIEDNLDSHPAGGDRKIPQTFSWSYGDYSWTLTESIQEDWFDHYRAKPRGEHPSVAYITSNDQFIKKISEALIRKATSDVPKTWVAITFVQSLSYVDDMYTGYNEYPKYPVETFFDKNGDCEDTSYLAASIVNAMDIGSVLIVLPGHMAIGVWMNCDTPGTYYELDGRCYYYVETTSKDFAGGEIPDRYRNTRATLIKIPSGNTASVYPQYKKPCYASSDFSGYYSDGNSYYSDSQCYNLVYCLPYKEYYFNPQVTTKLYWDSSCSQEVTLGCYKSTTYPGYFYKSGSAWYYDSQCTQSYQSMSCNYPSSLGYSCTSEYSYSSKKSTCDFYASYEFYQDAAAKCYAELPKCRSDIDEYQAKLNEYNQCTARKEY